MVWPVAKYEKEAFHKLKDRQKMFSQELHDILNKAYQLGIIPKNVLDVLIIKHPKVLTLYFLPRVHKNGI